jgi:oligoendopeptidase F
MEAALSGDNVSTDVYNNLIAVVNEYLPQLHRYMDLRKKMLGVDEVHMYDVYVPLVEMPKEEIPYEKGLEMINEALACMGEDYLEKMNKGFSDGWVDVYENEGKTSGAYSFGSYDSKPYILLNYDGKLQDVFTVIHEMGHSMHSCYTRAEQPFVYGGHSIFTAEVASTVNEVLLTKYLLSVETDKKRRAYILNHFLEGFRTTVFRQTRFAEFERKAHDAAKAGTPLTAEVLNKIYKDLNELYYEGAYVNELQSIEWARIPHFYNAFYVYQYATGFCSAVAIANNIYETGDVSGYLKFLSLGGSDYPIEELKVAGVDLTTPETVDSALKVFKESLDEFEALINEN